MCTLPQLPQNWQLYFVCVYVYVCMSVLTNNKTNPPKKTILKFRGIKQQPFYLTILWGGNLGNSAPCGFIWLPGGTELVTEFVWRVQDCLTHIPDVWDSWLNEFLWAPLPLKVMSGTLHELSLGEWTCFFFF